MYFGNRTGGSNLNTYTCFLPHFEAVDHPGFGAYGAGVDGVGMACLLTLQNDRAMIYKTVDLFGNETTHIIDNKKRQPKNFTDYEGFVNKFEVKKTTDDCYTPDNVYKCILDHIQQVYDLSCKNIVRPFYPGGDYEAIEYGTNDIVIDNPPFSIVAKIAIFYISKNIPFFIFAPHLTLFSCNDISVNYIVVGAEIEYENGAKVKTSFLSNIFGSDKIICDAVLYKKLKNAQKDDSKKLPVYKYPENVLTVSRLHSLVLSGVSITINKDSIARVSKLDDQKKYKKTIFGSGFLMSDEVCKQIKEKEKDKEKEKEKETEKEKESIAFELSRKELAIISKLK